MKPGAKKAIIAGGLGIAAVSTVVVAQKRHAVHDPGRRDDTLKGMTNTRPAASDDLPHDSRPDTTHGPANPPEPTGLPIE